MISLKPNSRLINLVNSIPCTNNSLNSISYIMTCYRSNGVNQDELTKNNNVFPVIYRLHAQNDRISFVVHKAGHNFLMKASLIFVSNPNEVELGF